MDAIELVKILDRAVIDTRAEKNVPMVDIDLTEGGLHFSSWSTGFYYVKSLSWTDVLASNGEAIMATIRRMQEDIKRRETDVESDANSNSDVG